MRHFVMGALVLGAMAAGSASAMAAPIAPEQNDARLAGGFIEEFGFTLAPLSFVKFCMNNAAECAPGRSGADGHDIPSLTQLQAVNETVNRSIAPRHKPTEPLLSNWTVGATSGDCNDYAVTKRHALIKAGWPADHVRLAVVIAPTGQGHLVVVARLADGDVVLDNLSDTVKPWRATPYEWVSMQSGENPRFWVAVGERGRRQQQRLSEIAANVR